MPHSDRLRWSWVSCVSLDRVPSSWTEKGAIPTLALIIANDFKGLVHCPYPADDGAVPRQGFDHEIITPCVCYSTISADHDHPRNYCTPLVHGYCDLFHICL